MQLKPVQGNWIFESPKNPQFQLAHIILPIWNLFQTIELTHNHRQGDDKSYGDLLNRLRILKKDEMMRDEDISTLESRVTHQWPENSVLLMEKCSSYSTE